jgi:hypothetical protein
MVTLRERFTEELKIAMRSKDTIAVSTIRMIMAKLKDADIVSRPSGVPEIPEDKIITMLRGMIKSRKESIELYEKGNRPELVAKEQAEIIVIERFLPAEINGDVLEKAIDTTIATLNATSPKDMGKVIAAIKAQFGNTLDFAKVSQMIKSKLSV